MASVDLVFRRPPIAGMPVHLVFGGSTPPPAAAGIKAFNGTAWVTATVKRWNGSTWASATTKRFDGNAWLTM